MAALFWKISQLLPPTPVPNGNVGMFCQLGKVSATLCGRRLPVCVCLPNEGHSAPLPLAALWITHLAEIGRLLDMFAQRGHVDIVHLPSSMKMSICPLGKRLRTIQMAKIWHCCGGKTFGKFLCFHFRSIFPGGVGHFATRPHRTEAATGPHFGYQNGKKERIWTVLVCFARVC